MARTRLVSLPCRISGGVFSTERAFEIDLPGPEKKKHTGFAPQHYFWDNQGTPIRSGEPEGDEEIKGRIAARIVGEEGGLIIVSIPDGEVVAVKESVLGPRPTEVTIHVPLRP